jgi:hypothetical protein
VVKEDAMPIDPEAEFRELADKLGLGRERTERLVKWYAETAPHARDADDLAARFAAIADDLGILPESREELLDWHDDVGDALAAEDENAQYDVLRSKWGASFDELESAAREAVTQAGLGQADVDRMLAESGVERTYEHLAMLAGYRGVPAEPEDPRPASQREAQLALDRMFAGHDPALRDAYLRGDPVARERVQALHVTAYPDPATPKRGVLDDLRPPSAEAKASLDALLADPAFVERYLGGDRAALAQVTEAHRAAYDAPAPAPAPAAPLGE